MFERSLERGHVRICTAVEIELCHRADPGSLAEPQAQRGIVEKELCRGNESLWVSRRNQVVHDEGPFTAEHRLRPEAQNAILATYRNVKSIIGGLPTAGIEIKPSIARQIELY